MAPRLLELRTALVQIRGADGVHDLVLPHQTPQGPDGDIPAGAGARREPLHSLALCPEGAEVTLRNGSMWTSVRMTVCAVLKYISGTLSSARRIGKRRLQRPQRVPRNTIILNELSSCHFPLPDLMCDVIVSYSTPAQRRSCARSHLWTRGNAKWARASLHALTAAASGSHRRSSTQGVQKSRSHGWNEDEARRVPPVSLLLSAAVRRPPRVSAQPRSTHQATRQRNPPQQSDVRPPEPRDARGRPSLAPGRLSAPSQRANAGAPPSAPRRLGLHG